MRPALRRDGAWNRRARDDPEPRMSSKMVPDTVGASKGTGTSLDPATVPGTALGIDTSPLAGPRELAVRQDDFEC